MIHKCPICRYQPVREEEEYFYCPDCGWELELLEEIDEMLTKQVVNS